MVNRYVSFIFKILLFAYLCSCGAPTFSDPKIHELYDFVKREKFEKAEDFLRMNPSLDLNLKNTKEETILGLTLKNNNINGFIWLLKKGASPNILSEDRQNSVMRLAAEAKNPEYLKQVLLYKGDINLPHRFGENPLYFASIVQSEKNIDILKANNVDGLHLDEYKNNTFTCLISFGQFKSFNLLINKGFKPLSLPKDLVDQMVSNLEGTYSNILPSAKNDFLQVVKYFNENGVKVELLSWEQYKKKYKIEPLQ